MNERICCTAARKGRAVAVPARNENSRTDEIEKRIEERAG